MLAQEKRFLAQELVTGALHIREKELHLAHDSLSAVGMQAALFAGFAFSALVEFDIPDDAAAWLVSAFYVMCAFALTLNLHCVVHAISVTVWGPGLALRGASADSMIRAVEGMQAERLLAFQMGFAGTVCIQLSAGAMSLLAMEPGLAAAVIAIVVLSVAG